jgi:hypothetical protein
MDLNCVALIDHLVSAGEQRCRHLVEGNILVLDETVFS